jgi:O-antigen/teichoic acid export membrane protein
MIWPRLEARFHKMMEEMGFPIGERTRALLQGLRWNAMAAAISRVLCGIATLSTARWLGPAAFGEANLALASTAWIQVPFLFGLPTALMHYVPQAPEQERDTWAAAGVTLMLATGLMTLGLGFAFTPFWARLQGITPYAFHLALGWCAGFAVYSCMTSLYSASERFPERARYELGFALLFPMCIGLFWLAGVLSASFYLLAFTISYSASGGWGLFRAWPRHGLILQPTPQIKRIMSYAVLACMGGIVNALLVAPGRLLAHRYLTITDVGLLSAYQGGSIQMSLFFVSIASQVFFPIASRTPDRKVLFQKINRILLLSAPAVTLAYIGLIWLYMSLLGKRYPIAVREVLVFAVAATLSGYFALLTWFLASKGRRGLVTTTTIGLIAGFLNIAGCYWSIPRWGVLGAGAAYGLSSFISILLCRLSFIYYDG